MVPLCNLWEASICVSPMRLASSNVLPSAGAAQHWHVNIAGLKQGSLTHRMSGEGGS